ncbi:MAG: transglycosylase SLT domain-containing protein [Rhodospirillales bacterium]|nr:transglycosylase SLT domain-containing protein [Rhodospirillales bacterium]MDH3790252.1 transglycosylase SLT domain-containing protein [Rhodospirillales bacterium]MDH3909660.1 transglycosylase SLT domain-containing protein [Rhodospirillales bacterium]MDH3918474.1 transglycosylase SLT domain-containing protein [Rhodospirillales bacterium]MDH3965743.1 transglycosylase SLT domain-containing protein [Rhodospirillales bacterium]
MCLPGARRTIACLALGLGLLAAAPEGLRAGAPDPWALCAEHAGAAARRSGLPHHLLGAIAKVEAGRWNAAEGAVIAWPWTVTAEGRGRYLPSRAAALAEVRTLRARGLSNIDVGCLQVNLRYHPEAFASLEDAFDPARNAAYAAGYLARLRQETGSWTTAIGRYHSRTPRLSGPYRLKVFRAWREARRQADRARIAAKPPAGTQPSSRPQAAPGQIARRHALASGLPLRP